jgi:hypothetical protein
LAPQDQQVLSELPEIQVLPDLQENQSSDHQGHKDHQVQQATLERGAQAVCPTSPCVPHRGTTQSSSPVSQAREGDNTMAVLLAEIMDAPEFGEIMFLVGFILFLIEFVRLIALSRNDAVTWGYHWLLVVAGLACISLGWLALPTDPTP